MVKWFPKLAWGRRTVAALLVSLLGLGPITAAAGPEWLPPPGPFPRSLADPREPAISLTYLTDPDRFDAALGVPLPLARFSVGQRDLTVILEAGAFFRLGKDGAFFPLRTFDGLLGMGLETAAGPFRGRLRAFHVSAHKADGDSTVAYRGRTYSRETWRLEGGWWWRRLFLFTGFGSSWHAVPEDRGIHVVGGGTWNPGGPGWSPVAALHLLADHERAWRVNQSLLVGMRTGTRREMRLGLRYYNGHRVEGQYWNEVERYLGVEVQFFSYPPD